MAVTEHHGRGSGGKSAVMLLLRGKHTACPELPPGPRASQEDGWRPHSLPAGRQAGRILTRSGLSTNVGKERMCGAWWEGGL